MKLENPKLLVLIVGVLLFSISGLSVVYGQTTPGSSYGRYGGNNSMVSGQDQYGNFTSHGSHSASFSHSGNFTRNASMSNMTSHSRSFPQNGFANTTSESTPQPNGTTSSYVPVTPTMPSATSGTLSSTNNTLPPLQQVKSGVATNAVVCQGNFQLILKTEDSSPACVDSTTFALLVERGWGHSP